MIKQWLVYLLGPFVIQLKILLLLLGEIFRRAKETIFSFSDENFTQLKVSPEKVSPDK